MAKATTRDEANCLFVCAQLGGTRMEVQRSGDDDEERRVGNCNLRCPAATYKINRSILIK